MLKEDLLEFFMNIEDLENDVIDFASEILNLCAKDSGLDEIFLGTQIFFSPMVYDADIMFLGINPGPGYYDYYEEKVERYYPLDKHEYIEYDYTLAQECKEIFSDIGRFDLLENSFKSNCSYFATRGTKEYNTLRNILWNYKGNEFNEKCEEWTHSLLEQVNPSLLICEGKHVANILKKYWYSGDYTESDSYSFHINSLNIDVMVAERTYSNLKNKSLIEKSLKNHICRLGLYPSDENKLPAKRKILSQIKDPYIIEFLGLKFEQGFSEKGLENAIISNLEKFLLEMGKGFSFVARQMHIKTETQDFYIDLVFYNYILKCFVLIDLKKGALKHQAVGQMDMYVRMFDALKKSPDDNPTIGIIFCADKDESIVKYSVLEESEQIFASKYKTVLPTEEELSAEFDRNRRYLADKMGSGL